MEFQQEIYCELEEKKKIMDIYKWIRMNFNEAVFRKGFIIYKMKMVYSNIQQNKISQEELGFLTNETEAQYEHCNQLDK